MNKQQGSESMQVILLSAMIGIDTYTFNLYLHYDKIKNKSGSILTT